MSLNKFNVTSQIKGDKIWNQMSSDPVLFPDMRHVKVDVADKQNNDCLFYLNNRKRLIIKKEINDIINQTNESDNKQSIELTRGVSRLYIDGLGRQTIAVIKTASKSTNKNTIKQKFNSTNNKTPLYYSKKKDQMTEKLLKQVRNNENKLIESVFTIY
mmetsp:Transcript_8980/g.8018  ORF Transcript_8980/g.8018 Transcript_8980/m.8018 type:complete len:158 (-) Transcript_8980:42-515(-)